MVLCWSSVCLSVRLSVFSLQDDNLNKYQWIFTKLVMWIDIVEIWFGIANGQILSIFDRVICLSHEWLGIIVSFFYLFWFHKTFCGKGKLSRPWSDCLFWEQTILPAFFFLFRHENRGMPNEYPQHTFSWRNNLPDTFSYLELGLSVLFN